MFSDQLERDVDADFHNYLITVLLLYECCGIIMDGAYPVYALIWVCSAYLPSKTTGISAGEHCLRYLICILTSGDFNELSGKMRGIVHLRLQKWTFLRGVGSLA